MAVVPLTSPYSLKAATFEVELDDFTAAVSQVQFDPSTSSTTWRGIGGNVRKDQSVAEWTCTLGLAQDLAPGGLLRYLLDNEGQTKDVVFTPTTGGPAIEATLIIAPGTIGGSADGNTAVATVQIAVDGKPAFNDAPALAADEDLVGAL
jgi:hypothetical protein